MLDSFIHHFDRALKSLAGGVFPRRPCPQADPVELSAEERQRSIALMRVNHAGEVAAQALYQGQALFSRNPELRKRLQEAADEELDHLAWTRQRVESLGGRTSLLDPFWYAGALAIGAFAGVLGDKISLGFLEITEEQVEAHLASHLDQLPEADHASRAIVAQMKQDEAAHAQTARDLGSESLPWFAQELMRASAKVMTTLAAKI